MSEARVNDWDLLSDELEAIKATARHEGYQAALADSEALQRQIQEREKKVRSMVETWHLSLQLIRDSWGKVSKKKSKDKFGKYEPFFGHKTMPSKEGLYINMPEDLDEFSMALFRYVRIAQDFETLLDAFNKNPMVKAQWDRIVVMMRMTGDDT